MKVRKIHRELPIGFGSEKACTYLFVESVLETSICELFKFGSSFDLFWAKITTLGTPKVFALSSILRIGAE